MNAIERLLDVAERHADRVFLVETATGRELTFGAIHERAQAVAAALRARGLQRGERIAVVANNSAPLALLYFGCLYAGVVVVPLNPALAPPELHAILEDSGVRLLVVSGETAGLVGDAAGDLETIALADGRREDRIPDGLERLDPDALPPGAGAPFAGVDARDRAVVIYTSGTTGRPKGVAHRIADLVDNGAAFSEMVGVRPGHRFYGILAMTYLGGYYNLLLLPYVAGASVALAEAFDGRSALDFWTPAARHGVTALWVVPTIMSILLEMDRGDAGERFGPEHVDLTLAGTAPLPLPLRSAFEERYGLTVLENYGLSETTFISANTMFEPVVDRSVGRLLPGVDVRFGEGGEIEVRTPYLMEGYLGAEPLAPGTWFPTGDLGELDDEGRLFITGRKKDLIIRGGVNVSPAAAEEVLLEHPAVLECAVIGVPHKHYGEVAVAVLRLAEGVEVSDIRTELVSLCRDRLGATNRPSSFEAVPDMPRSTSGKIQKNALRDRFAVEAGA